MSLSRLLRSFAAISLFLVASGAAPAQRRPALTALNGIELGLWRLKEADGGTRQLCIANRWAVLQLMHGSTQCQHFVMENTPRSATIRYTCPSHGHGRTTIAVETPRVMRIDTQGVADGAPFAAQYQARRVGACN